MVRSGRSGRQTPTKDPLRRQPPPIPGEPPIPGLQQPALIPPRDPLDDGSFDIAQPGEAPIPRDCDRWLDSPYCPVPLPPLLEETFDLIPEPPGGFGGGRSGGGGAGGAIPDPPAGEAPPDQDNPFDEGWSPGCRYFVLLRLNRPDASGSVDSRWDRFGGLERFNSLIIPAYGPITALRFELSVGPGVRSLIVRLECGGLGMFSSSDSSVPTNRPTTSWTHWLGTEFPERIWRYENSFLAPPPPASINRGWRAAWFEPPGNYFPPGNNGRVSNEGFVARPYSLFFTTIQTGQQNARFLIPSFYDIRQAADIEPFFSERDNQLIYLGSRCGPPPPPPPPPIDPKPDPDEPMSCCDCADIAALIDRKLRPIYRILGFPQVENPKTTITPEMVVDQLGRIVYGSAVPGAVEVETLGQLQAAIASTIFFRAGLHRLPAQLPELKGDAKDLTEAPDMVSFLEWFVTQVDDILGHFPVKIQVAQEDGSDKEISLDSISDAIAELSGILVSISDDANLSAHYAARATTEAARASNAAMIAQDYAKANSQYMGYKGNQVERVVRASFTPISDLPEQDQDGRPIRAMRFGRGSGSEGSSNGEQSSRSPNRDSLNPSTQRIPGFQWDGDDSLQDILNKLLVGVGIIKAALVTPYERGGRVTGDAIRRDLDRDGIQDDDQWETFLNERRNPPARRQIENTPNIEIRDISEPGNPAD